MSHAHHWLMEDGQEATWGTCKACGERRYFSGGLDSFVFIGQARMYEPVQPSEEYDDGISPWPMEATRAADDAEPWW
ncbi:MAG: hypothetical protein KGL39_53690 [Patescibacteria group bacterium]|nr:hypothetical protein [Patescibacteria group bacterium]